MKIMSEGLQKIAGPSLRRILGVMTSNRLAGVGTGFLATTAVQSSSATTVMVVSFVNAGLLTLVQATGVIMGANIGTTVTAWLVSVLGFSKVKIVTYAIVLIGLSFPFLFSKRERWRNIAEFVLGFGILFIGLDFLKGSVPNVKDNPGVLAFLENWSSFGYGSYLIFIAVGTVLTIIVQSSSATTAITLAMVASGYIRFDMAAAMVLGENIGTTITANIAALVGNVHAKRAARFHTLFNVIGVLWMLAVFPVFIQMVDWLNMNLIQQSESIFVLDDPDVVVPVGNITLLTGVALFHTSFNVINTSVMYFFAPALARIATRLVKPRSGVDEEFRLKYISSGLMETPEFSIEEAKKEVQNFGNLVERMCGSMMTLIFETPRDPDKLYRKIKKREEITDNMELEIAQYLSRVGEQKLSEENARRVRSLLRISNELERMGDIFFQLTMNKRKVDQQRNGDLPEAVKAELQQYFGLILQAIKDMNLTLEGRYGEGDLRKVFKHEEEINRMRDTLKQAHFDRIEKGQYNVQSGILYLDFVNSAEKLGDHIVNINEAFAGSEYARQPAEVG